MKIKKAEYASDLPARIDLRAKEIMGGVAAFALIAWGVAATLHAAKKKRIWLLPKK